MKTSVYVRWDKFIRFLPGCFSLVAGLGFVDVWPSGCRASYVALSPAAVVVPADHVWAAAQYYASLRPNAIAVTGDGNGMMPLYASGTVLVVEGRDYGSLRAGMSVMFRDDQGFRMVHFLLKRTPDGWTTLGLNQGNREDRSPLTRQNYLGVVVMAFTPDSPSKPSASPGPSALPPARSEANAEPEAKPRLK